MMYYGRILCESKTFKPHSLTIVTVIYGNRCILSIPHHLTIFIQLVDSVIYFDYCEIVVVVSSCLLKGEEVIASHKSCILKTTCHFFPFFNISHFRNKEVIVTNICKLPTKLLNLEKLCLLRCELYFCGYTIYNDCCFHTLYLVNNSSTSSVLRVSRFIISLIFFLSSSFSADKSQIHAIQSQRDFGSASSFI